MAKISINNISNAIYESLKDKKGSDLDLAILNTIQLLKDKHLLSKKEEILERLEKIIDKEEGVVRAKIHTRDKLGSKGEKDLEEYIKHKYKAKQVYLEKIENKEILGGIKVEIGNEITDLSLSKKLHQLQNYLITN